MEKFIAFNPTKLHFGRGVVNDLGAYASESGSHALLVYGKGSVLLNGSYKETLNQLDINNIKVTEFNGIKPNPLVGDVMEAAEKGRKNGVDMVVAIGGGSVIDSAKIIAICIAENCEAWEVMSGIYSPTSALPLVAVLTLAATGTEMNAIAVLQNPETRQKKGFRNDLIYPVHSFLDPAYTLTVPVNQTAYGIVDLIAHCLEAWFGEGEASLSDRFVISIIQEAMEFGPALLKNPASYDLRSRIMWAATNALNNITIYGRKSGDWGVHVLSHDLSFLYDTPHGATLSIIYPAWMKMMRSRAKERIEQLGIALFGKADLDGIILEFESLFTSLGCPVRCEQAGIEASAWDEILELANRNLSQGLNHKLSEKERKEVISYMF